MKNVHILTKLGRLKKTLAVSISVIGLSFSANAFKTSGTSDGEPKKQVKDSSLTDKYGFKSLLINNVFDPAKSYVAQLNPMASSFVKSYVQSHTTFMEKLKSWGKPYLDMYDDVLNQYGLPVELKYLSVIESNLKAGAVSVAGAVGPWQIMSFEARRLGLTVNSRNDERTSYIKSTHAAAKILKELYTRFGDWLLVIAAYNAGGGRVSQAIKKSGSRNFWVLQNYLPLETRNHVKKFIATQYLFEGNGGLTTLTAAETEAFRSTLATQAKQKEVAPESEDGIGLVEVSGKYNAAVLVKNLGMDIAMFNKLNPNFDKWLASGSSYKLRLPVDKVLMFEEKKQIILNETVQSLLAAPARINP